MRRPVRRRRRTCPGSQNGPGPPGARSAARPSSRPGRGRARCRRLCRRLVTAGAAQGLEELLATIGVAGDRRGVGRWLGPEVAQPGDEPRSGAVAESDARHAACRQVGRRLAQPQVEPAGVRAAADAVEAGTAGVWIGGQIEAVAAGASPPVEEQPAGGGLTVRHERRVEPVGGGGRGQRSLEAQPRDPSASAVSTAGASRGSAGSSRRHSSRQRWRRSMGRRWFFAPDRERVMHLTMGTRTPPKHWKRSFAMPTRGGRF